MFIPAKKILGVAYRKALYSVAMLMAAALCLMNKVSFGQQTDTAVLLKSVIISADLRPQLFRSTTPVQALNKKQLETISANSIGDAARYFSGVIIKDYGGTGGLKTISVRSLGAAHTGILYDGIPISDVQTGQIDLSRFSTTFVQSLQLHLAGTRETLIPARAAASGTTVAIESNSFDLTRIDKRSWQTGFKAGSFEQIQPFAGLYLPLNERLMLSANVEGTYSKGNYPVSVANGNLITTSKRNNSAVRALQSEVNLVYITRDSSNWQTKIGSYFSDRGLPGPIIFFNDRSVQQLTNNDLYAQSRLKLRAGEGIEILISAKYQYNRTRYLDVDFPNNLGGLRNDYRQQEIYVGGAVGYKAARNLMFGLASDIALTNLRANTINYNAPIRIASWNNLSAKYSRNLWQVDGSLLHNHITDKTNNNPDLARNEFTPAIAMSVKPSKDGPLMFRVFYKRLFRMPTFNDLYYNLVGSSTLKPEFANHFNFGLSFSRTYQANLKKLGASIDVYHLRVKDKIVAVPSRNLFVWTMLNLGVVHINGLDVTTEMEGKVLGDLNWFTRLAYTWQNALDKTATNSPTYNNRIPYTPDHSGSALLSFNHRQWTAGPALLFSGGRYTLGENNSFNELDGWITCDVSVARQFRLGTNQLTAKAELINLSDARFDVVRYYPMPGRSYKVILTLINL